MRLGEYQELYYGRKTDFGIYLTEEPEGGGDSVLLPIRQVPQGVKRGDRIQVFLYRDSKDRLIATTARPYLTIGHFAPLKIKEVGKIGAFLDWGLEKDLFLPFKEMTARVEPEDEVLVRLYIDKSGRLCGSMKGIYELLRKDSPYRAGNLVSGRVYEFSDNFGTFVAVDDQFSGRIDTHEDCSFLKIGDVIDAKVAGVKADGKLDLTLREKAYIQVDADAERILALLESYAGVLPFTEKASPEVIKRETGLSKGAFKRAIGHLYKERKISLDGGKIRKG